MMLLEREGMPRGNRRGGYFSMLGSAALLSVVSLE
jgi:hypothetical protein